MWIFPFQTSGKNWILKKPSKNLGDVHPKPCQPQGSQAAAKPSHGKPTEVSPRLVVVDLGSLYGLGNLLRNEVQGIWQGKWWYYQRKTWRFGWLKRLVLLGFVGRLIFLVGWLVGDGWFFSLVNVDFCWFRMTWIQIKIKILDSNLFGKKKAAGSRTSPRLWSIHSPTSVAHFPSKVEVNLNVA